MVCAAMTLYNSPPPAKFTISVLLLDFPPPIFGSADTELNAVAISEGLVVDDPNSHP